MRPRRYRLRLYVRAARSIVWALNRLSDWEIARMYPPQTVMRVFVLTGRSLRVLQARIGNEGRIGPVRARSG
jgi:hypothetical protein